MIRITKSQVIILLLIGLGVYLFSEKRITTTVVLVSLVSAVVFSVALNANATRLEMFDKPTLEFKLEDMGKIDTHQKAIRWSDSV